MTSRRFVYNGSNTRSIKISSSIFGFEEMMNDVVTASEEVTRPAAQSGAQVVYLAVKSETPISKRGHYFHGTQFKVNGTKYWFDSGTLRNSIYQVYSKDNSNQQRATYHVSWNFSKCPYAYMVHNGTIKTSAKPFVLNGIDISRQQAQIAMRDNYFKLMRGKGVFR